MSKQADKTNKPAQPKAARPKTPQIQQTPVDSHLLQLARKDPARLTPTQRIHLQRTLGNRALSQLVDNQSSVNSDRSSVNGEQSSSPAHPFTRSPGHPVTLSPGHKTIQPKLTVNAVGDKYEQEADAVAKEVVQKLKAPQPAAATTAPTAPPTHARRQTEEEEPIAQRIQRQAAPHSAVAASQPDRDAVLTVPPALQRQEVPEDELQLQRQETKDEDLQLQRQELEEEEPQEMAMLQREAVPEEEELQLQRQELPEEEEIQLHRQALEEEDPEQLAMTQHQPQDFTHGGPVNSHIEAQINQSSGGGQPMEDSIRQPMEQAFGADFSDVRIHTDAQAHALNEAIQARAFTTGNDIFFKEGEYSPNVEDRKKLLAHELTHVVQQNNKNTPISRQLPKFQGHNIPSGLLMSVDLSQLEENKLHERLQLVRKTLDQFWESSEETYILQLEEKRIIDALRNRQQVNHADEFDIEFDVDVFISPDHRLQRGDYIDSTSWYDPIIDSFGIDTVNTNIPATEKFGKAIRAHAKGFRVKRYTSSTNGRVYYSFSGAGGEILEIPGRRIAEISFTDAKRMLQPSVKSMAQMVHLETAFISGAFSKSNVAFALLGNSVEYYIDPQKEFGVQYFQEVGEDILIGGVSSVIGAYAASLAAGGVLGATLGSAVPLVGTAVGLVAGISLSLAAEMARNHAAE